MQLTKASFVLFYLIRILASVVAQSCKPTRMVLARGTGSEAMIYPDGEFRPRYELSTVNMANPQGVMKYIQAEAIDRNKDYADCNRKNKVRFIHFYEMTVCNPDKALKFFNTPPRAGGEFGNFMAMDRGKCNHQYCSRLTELGPYIGFQDSSSDPRAPTDEAYWFSFPGKCYSHDWKSKTNSCKREEKGGKCPKGVQPDGVKCTWSSSFLGQVNLDDLVGITSTINPKTGQTFKNATEFCRAGYVEFERDPETKEFVRGLPFWHEPTNRAKNAERVRLLLQVYKMYPNNKPLPRFDGKNPACYKTIRKCGDGVAPFTIKCKRNRSQICMPCATCRPSLGWQTQRFPVLV